MRSPPRATAAALLGAWLAAAPALAAEASYEVSARTDVRTRTPLPGDLGTLVSGDVELLPVARGALRWPTQGLFAQYFPSVLLREPHLQQRVAVLHRAQAGHARRFSRGGLALRQDAAWGTQDVGALRALDGARPQDNPVAQTLGLVPYQSFSTWLAFDAPLGARATLDGAAGYLSSGSQTRPDALPLQWGPAASLSLRLLGTRTDAFTTTARAAAARFITGQEQLVAQLSETWERRLSTDATLQVGAGVALTREVIVPLPFPNPPPPGTYLDVLPVANARLAWRQAVTGQPLQLSAGVSVAPFADRFTGFVYERLEGRAEAQWRPREPLALTAAVGAAWAVPVGRSEQAGDRLAFAEASAAWAVRDWATVGFSGRALYSEQPRFNTPGQLQALGIFFLMVQDRGSTSW